MNKKVKIILLAVLAAAILVFGVSRLNIQSVEEYQREGKEMANPTAVPDKEESGILQCSIEIRCDSILAHRDQLASVNPEYIPDDGVILSRKNITVKKGTTAYQALSQVCQAEGIALDSEYTPAFGGYYVRGIGHLYEADTGAWSGWLYTINGEGPEVGASDFLLSEGDAVLWRYTCEELD